MYTPLKFATNTLNQSRSIGWPKNPTLEPSIIGGLHDPANFQQMYLKYTC